MKSIMLAAALGASLVVTGAARAQDAKAAEELARKSACMACHATDKKMVGPSYREVAAKYRDRKDAEAYLADKVRKGGKGVWGDIPMPPNAGVKDEDIRTIVRWILTTK